jgi:hypothetical protein
MSDVLLDPTLFRPSDLPSLGAAVERLRNQAVIGLYVPGSLLDGLQRGRVPRSLIGLPSGAADEPAVYLDDAALSSIQDWFAHHTYVRGHTGWREVGPLPSTYATNLDVLASRRLQHYPPETAMIREEVELEEWDFLQSHSLVASRLKRPFSSFVRKGAIAVELGRHWITAMEGRTLKVGADAELRAIDHLRVAAKWFAAGGPSAVALAYPLIGVPLQMAGPWFLLLDP